MQIITALILLLSLNQTCDNPGAPVSETNPTPRILVFSRTEGYRHASIPAAIVAIESLGVMNGFAVDSTEDNREFSDSVLNRYAAVVFLSTTGDVLDPDQEAAFERFIRSGKGFAGIHAASDTEYGWPWYGMLVGAWFDSHPAIQQARIRRLDSLHLSTKSLPAVWTRRDEWYNFRTAPPESAHVLLDLDETTYNGGTMGTSHPISWYHDYDGGRSWYTALGHTVESFSEPEFLKHIGGGILWAAGIMRDSVGVQE